MSSTTLKQRRQGVQPLLDQAAAQQVRIAVAAVDPQRPIEGRQRGGELAAVAVDIGFHLEQPGPEQAVLAAFRASSYGLIS